MKIFSASNQEKIKFFTTLLIEFAKLFAILAGPVGIAILIVYLQSVRAPLPISEFSTAPTLVIVAGVYSILVAVIACSLVIPLLFCSVSVQVREEVRMRSLSYLPYVLKLPRFLKNHIFLFQCGSLFVIVTFNICMLLATSASILVIAMLVAALLGSVLGVVLLYNGGRIFGNYAWQFRTTAIGKLLGASLCRSLACFLWVVASEIAISGLAYTSVIPNTLLNHAAIRLLSFIGTTVTYVALSSIYSMLDRLSLFVGAAVCVALFSGSGFSKKTLHFLGIGGGIPVEILLRTMEADRKEVIARLVPGCLILNAGSRVIIQPMADPTESACSRELSPEELKPGTMYQKVTVFSGSDIIKISGFTAELLHV